LSRRLLRPALIKLYCYFPALDEVFSEYVCSPSSTSSPRWLCTVARVVTMPVSARVLDIVVDRVIVSRNRLESGGMRIRQCAAWRAEYVGDA
jgi:hypothetical protein